MKKPISFATETEVEIDNLLDGEPLARVLPDLTGNESPEEILSELHIKLGD
tara:strand:+ start:199 stop:351 length:153 start_codon:yes stop_codon:yes gene_type:complete